MGVVVLRTLALSTGLLSAARCAVYTISDEIVHHGDTESQMWSRCNCDQRRLATHHFRTFHHGDVTDFVVGCLLAQLFSCRSTQLFFRLFSHAPTFLLSLSRCEEHSRSSLQSHQHLHLNRSSRFSSLVDCDPIENGGWSFWNILRCYSYCVSHACKNHVLYIMEIGHSCGKTSAFFRHVSSKLMQISFTAQLFRLLFPK